MTHPNSSYFEVPEIAKTFGQMAAADWNAVYQAGSDLQLDPYEVIQSNASNQTTVSLDSNRSMWCYNGSSVYSGLHSVYGVRAYLPGKLAETVINAVFDCIIGDCYVGLCLNPTQDTTPAPDVFHSLMSIFFSGYHGKVLMNVNPQEDNAAVHYVAGDSGNVDNIYMSNAITNFSKAVRNQFHFKIVISKGTTVGIRIMFYINGIIQSVSNVIVDADLDVIEDYLLCPYLYIGTINYATGIRLYQWSVARI